MKLKQIPEDFVVREVYELNRLLGDNKEDSAKTYKYVKLTKKDYSQQRAIDKVARIFSVSRKNIHFAGTKDKVGITTQIISINGISEDRLNMHLRYFNENVDDIELEYIGAGDKRINLGDNLGNDFEIIIRDLVQSEIDEIEENISKIRQNGTLNYYDSQRFGYANNSHKIGILILKNEIKQAVYEILTSVPQNPNEKISNFAKQVEENFDSIENGDQKIIKQIIEQAPKFMYIEKSILEHLKKHKNDFPGALRTIPKKMRTMYISAYQSYIFNKLLDKFENKYSFLPLINSGTVFENEEIESEVKKILQEDDLTLENFELNSMPELKVDIDTHRKAVVYADGIDIVEVLEDDLNENKLKAKVKFFLEKGAYATNVVKSLLQ